MDDAPPDAKTNLQWTNVGLGLSFIVFDAVVSRVLGLGVGGSLFTAAIRCIVQLAVVATILERVFETESAFAVAGIALLLNFMGTFETVANKCKRRYQHMLPAVLVAMLFSTIPVSILGVRFAMNIQPFWKPEQYIPIVGMLCGSTISNIAVSVNYFLKELDENRDKTETYLAFGASRFEAVLGIIAIPGMMTGAILGGSSVQQAAKLQMVIMFLISSASTLSCIITTVFAFMITVDNEHRIRHERIDCREHAIWRARDWLIGRAYAAVERLERAIESIQSTIEDQGGALVIKMKPKAVSETDEQDLAQLMAKAGQENAEVSGDEDEEEAIV
ncbi:hypothetical protein EWM64_g9212 [Hericium alpestre]|uniref:Uncharacterized protein n=1 Tax=Hericium alpestre TaxID=135208 RepID=A0A4Y9ZN04_9AGAM|nr:hypothetical protein EWM64_g9212 [Hericium alpestre]